MSAFPFLTLNQAGEGSRGVCEFRSFNAHLLQHRQQYIRQRRVLIRIKRKMLAMLESKLRTPSHQGRKILTLI